MRIPEIKLFCTDIDGTLLDANRWLSEETISAFAKADLPIILASSRPPQAMRYLQDGLGISGAPLIAYNGGLILGSNGLVIGDYSFSIEILEKVITHHTKHQYNLSIYSHEHWFTDQEDTWSLREIRNTRTAPTYQSASKSHSFLANNNLGIHKLMCMGPPEELDSLTKLLEPIYKENVHLYRSKDTYLEITPKDIDKAKALKKLLSQEYDLGLENVMSFGDNHNDEELIKNTRYGVAVGNATDQLKKIADSVSPFTNKEHAVAKAIIEFL